MLALLPERYERLAVWILAGALALILLVEGDATARIIGSVILLLVVGSMVRHGRHRRLAKPS